MNERGWTDQSIRDAVKNAGLSDEIQVMDTRIANDPQYATAYIVPGGSYVIVNDLTNEVVQIGDATKLGTWKLPWQTVRFLP